MHDPLQTVRAMTRGADAVWLDRDLWRALLRAHALPASGPRAPKMIRVRGVPVRQHEMLQPEGRA